MKRRAWLSLFFALALAIGSAPLAALSGTTGGVTGRIVDSTTNSPLSNVSVTVTSPSQASTTTTDAFGTYRFLSLAPDTYTISFQKDGYNPVSEPGLSILADHVQTLNAALTPSLKTIAQVRSRSAMDVVKPGTTSDVYSVDAAGQQAARSLIGPGGLNNAYGAIASVPGVAIDPGEQGWFQTVHIRGGDIDQVGWELDGIPVNRVYDNAPQTMLSSFGQQELQVYTGGTPATADAQGIAGYVNQVIKTGTYPGFGTLYGGLGTPAFYHTFSAEAGGSTPNRLFSYYVGIGAANQDYRYVDSSNGGGASNLSWFFYPVNAVPGQNGFVFTGDCSFYFGCSTTPPIIDPAKLFTTGSAYGIAYTRQRDNVVNLHFGIPHKKNSLRDDVQLLYLTSDVNLQYYSSANDFSPDIAGCDCAFGPLFWDDAYLYTGKLMSPIDASQLQQYFYPSSPHNRDFNNTLLPLSQRDTNDNGVAITKLQYQHTFSENAFLRVYGYTLYSNWFIDGPNSAAQPLYGAELADYEIPNHTYGVNLSLTDQISSKHLLTASGQYTGTNLQRYSAGFFTGGTSRPIALLLDANNTTCFSQSGTPEGCYFAVNNGDVLGGSAINSGTIPAPPNGTQWVAVDKGLKANLNQVQPRFSGVSLTDQWRPNDRWTVNAGVRVENFKYLLGDTSPNDPARQFWFSRYNAEFCFGPTSTSPQMRTGNGLGPCPAGTLPLQPNGALGETAAAVYGPIVDKSGGDISTTRWQPRFGFTYTLNPDTVLRGSAGVYARPQNSSWVQYNTVQEDLASFIGGHFYSYGFNTPEHDIRPDTSYNYDISLEKRLHGTDWSFKVTPFYRRTRDQLQNFFIDPLTGLESGLNVGQQTSYGVEFALRKGDFANDGWSGALSYTYTHSRIKYQNFPNGSARNVIDNLNSYIQDYNQYTSKCATSPSSNPNSPCYYPGGTPTLQSGVAPAPCYTTSGAPDPSCAATSVVNPYWNAAPQPLLDRNGSYTTYDVIPGPVSAENGYETPHVASLILNYRHGPFAITPSVNFTSGASYGAPLSWPGYRPETCSAGLGTPAATALPADPVSCSDAGALPVFTPDPFSGGKFDALGAFQQPWRVSLNLNLSYDVSKNVTADVLLSNLVDHCGQRGYAWDNPNVCVYSNLPSGIFYPGGNFFPNSLYAAVPIQMKYPYTFWLNNNNTGFVGVKIPFQATFSVRVKM
jgi:outer membrane receptor protein involved in Fe transport